VKGTEFRIMVLIGVEDGLVPLSGSDETPEERDRERSLLFVAATRAREGLVCTAVGRPSEFIEL
jgi:superfamily I DNA/RNA helicase